MSMQPPPLTPPLDEVGGPIPADNQPGHHPEHEQDKPEVPPARRPRRPKAATTPNKTTTSPAKTRQRFPFAVDPTMAPIARLFGVTEDSAWVEVGDSEVIAKFGPWVLRTPRSNVVEASLSGPYAWAKVVGGPRLSFRDRGITFATSTQRGVCLRFAEPVGGVLPVPFLRHPGLTVTPDDPEGLVQALTA